MIFPLVFLNSPLDQLVGLPILLRMSIITFCSKSWDQVAPGANLKTVAIVFYGSLKSRIMILAKEECIARWDVFVPDCRLHSTNTK